MKSLKAKIIGVVAALALLVGVGQASAQNFSSVAVLNGSCGAPSFTFYNDTDSGFYLLSAGTVVVCINGSEVARITSNGISSTVSGAPVSISQSGGTVVATTPAYSGSTSVQALAGDLNLGASPGSSDVNDPKYLAGGMGNVIRDGAVANAGNILAGLVGKLTISGNISSSYPAAGLIGEVAGSNQGKAFGVASVISDGDYPPNPTYMRAFFGVDYQATDAYGSKVDWGLDLGGEDSYGTHTLKDITKADIRLSGDVHGTEVCISRIAGPPGVLAKQGICGRGSLLIDTVNGGLYQNTGDRATPVWTAR